MEYVADFVKFLMVTPDNFNLVIDMAQLAGFIEYTDCISAQG